MQVDGQEADMRRQHRTSGQRTAKSISIKMRSVDPTIAHGRRLNLPREICRAVRSRRLRPSRGGLTARQKSAEGVVGGAFPTAEGPNERRGK